MMTHTTEDILEDVKKQLGSDFVSSGVIGMDGLSIAETAADPNLNIAPLAARFAMVMRLSEKVSGKMGTGAVEDNLITTDKAYMLLCFLGDKSYYWGLSVTKEATLGIVRMLMAEYAEKLWNSLPR